MICYGGTDQRECFPKPSSAAENIEVLYSRTRFLLLGETVYGMAWNGTVWQVLEVQIAAQRDGMEELAGQTHQLVEENDQVPQSPTPLRMRASRLRCGKAGMTGLGFTLLLR